MRLALPERPIRRADVLVASLVVAWVVGWTAVEAIRRTIGNLPPKPSVGVILLLGALSLVFWAPLLYGIAWGRRWGFVGTAVLSAMGSVGALVNPLVRSQPILPMNLVNASLQAALLVYCGVRLGQERVERPEIMRPPALRFSDALVGALGAAWVLGMASVIVRSPADHPLRSSDVGPFGLLGLFGLLYVIASTGVVFGRRWGFVSMVVMSIFILMGEVGFLLSIRLAIWPETGIAAFSAVALAYCAFRLLRPVKAVRVTSAPPQSSG